MRRCLPFISVCVFLVALIFAFATQRPVAATSKAAARGAETFNNHSCAKCHGVDGINGDRAPDLQKVRDRMDAAAIAKQIREGGKGMPAFGDQLSDKEVDDLVAYLRTKRKVFVPPPPAAEPAPTKNPDN